MGQISFGQLVAANFWLILVVAVVLVGVALATAVWRRGRRRRMPAVIDGVRFECQDVRVIDDMVVEQDWQVTFLLTNVTKRPVPMPAVGARGTVRAGNSQYAGSVRVERAPGELNPGDQIVVWLSCRLPADRVPECGVLSSLRESRAVDVVFRLVSRGKAKPQHLSVSGAWRAHLIDRVEPAHTAGGVTRRAGPPRRSRSQGR